MRVMVLAKASGESEAGQMPSEELLAAMGAFNEELVEAGVMLGGDGLHLSLEAEDFGEELTPELREQEQRLRERLGG